MPSAPPAPTAMSSASPQVAGPRGSAGFGGLVPSAAVARAGDTLVAVLAVEHHADGALLPLLVVSGAPGALGWDLASGLDVRDDTGRRYEVQPVSLQSGLGALQATVWIRPAPPPSATSLAITASGLIRTGAARGGPGVPRALAGETWVLEVPLYPERTTAPVPPTPTGSRLVDRPAHVPARAFGAFLDLVPIGQARMADGAALCLWALERYRERAVLTVAALVDEPARVGPIAAGHGHVDVWDDRGGRYSVAPVHGTARPGWSESALEILPALHPQARALGIRLADLPEEPSPGGSAALRGPFAFGVRLPPP